MVSFPSINKITTPRMSGELQISEMVGTDQQNIHSITTNDEIVYYKKAGTIILADSLTSDSGEWSTTYIASKTHSNNGMTISHKGNVFGAIGHVDHDCNLSGRYSIEFEIKSFTVATDANFCHSGIAIKNNFLIEISPSISSTTINFGSEYAVSSYLGTYLIHCDGSTAYLWKDNKLIGSRSWNKTDDEIQIRTYTNITIKNLEIRQFS